jgi:hypothetical protein
MAAPTPSENSPCPPSPPRHWLRRRQTQGQAERWEALDYYQWVTPRGAAKVVGEEVARRHRLAARAGRRSASTLVPGR